MYLAERFKMQSVW